MSVWMLHLKLTPEEEENVTSRDHLVLPIEDLPDLSQIHSESECARLLRTLYPDLPPESLARKIERSWRIYSALQKEDIVAVPLPSRKEIALAEISGPYAYRVGEQGTDVHAVPVTWHEKRVPFRSLMKYRPLREPEELLHEVEDNAVRIALRDRLPHTYNRFAGLKWLFVLFFGWHAVKYFIDLVRQ